MTKPIICWGEAADIKGRLESKVRRGYIPLLLSALLILSANLIAEYVSVKGSERGTGVTRKHGIDCYVVAPYHLVGNVDVASVVGPGKRTVGATVLHRLEREDLAVLRIDSRDALSFCEKPWLESGSSDYASQSDWRAVTANIDGSTSFANMVLTDTDKTSSRVEFRPQGKEADLLFEGLSGSVILSEKKAVGIILDVDPEKRIASGYSWRHLNALVQEFFDSTADWSELPKLDGKPAQAIEIFNGRLVVGTNGGSIYTLDEQNEWVEKSVGVKGRKILCLRSVGVYLLAGFDSWDTKQGGYALTGDDYRWIDMGLTNFIVQSIRNRGVDIYIGAYGGYFTGVVGKGDLKFANDGLPGTGINAIEVVPGAVFAGLGPTPQGALAVLRDGASQWVPVADYKGQDVHALTSNSTYLFAATTTDGVFRTKLDGSGTVGVNSGFPANSVVQALAARGDTILAGTNGRGIWISTNSGSSWSDFNSAETRNQFILSLKITDDGRLYAGTHSGRVFVTGLGSN